MAPAELEESNTANLDFVLSDPAKYSQADNNAFQARFAA